MARSVSLFGISGFGTCVTIRVPCRFPARVLHRLLGRLSAAEHRLPVAREGYPEAVEPGGELDEIDIHTCILAPINLVGKRFWYTRDIVPGAP